MLKIEENFRIGNPCYPKSDGLIIPANACGSMDRGIASKIAKDSLSGVPKQAKEFAKNNKIEVGTCFSTGPGRLNRRGVKKIYHAVIKRTQNDFTSIFVVEKALTSAILMAINDGLQSVTICGIGIEPGELDPKTLARIIYNKYVIYRHRIEIKVIDKNAELISELNNFKKDN